MNCQPPGPYASAANSRLPALAPRHCFSAACGIQPPSAQGGPERPELLSALDDDGAVSAHPPESQNVIFCIGDGMGLSQVTLASVKATGLGGQAVYRANAGDRAGPDALGQFAVTDSAAAGTALACGVKTNNGMIGVTPDGRLSDDPRSGKGQRHGHRPRGDLHDHPCDARLVRLPREVAGTEAAIAEQLIANQVNVLFGGGRKYFLPKSDPNSGRKDDRDLLAEARQAGYTYIRPSASCAPPLASPARLVPTRFTEDRRARAESRLAHTQGDPGAQNGQWQVRP